MKYRSFSNLGWKISEIGLGCWGIGGSWSDVSNENAKKILKTAVDKGVNFFDTSDSYGHGRSERILGNYFKNSSVERYITTKVGTLIKPHIPENYTLSIFEKSVDRSLKNLKQDTIDLLQIHCPPKQIIQDYDFHEILNKLIKKGKIKHYGISVFSLEEAYESIKFKNVKSVQLVFNIFRKKGKKEFFKKANSKNIAIIARGSLASGILTGTINKNTKFVPSDHRNYNLKGKSFNIAETFSGIPLDASFSAIKRLKKLLPKNYSLIELALKWVLMQKEVTVVIPGAINSLQVELNSSVSEKKKI